MTHVHFRLKHLAKVSAIVKVFFDIRVSQGKFNMVIKSAYKGLTSLENCPDPQRALHDEEIDVYCVELRFGGGY